MSAAAHRLCHADSLRNCLQHGVNEAEIILEAVVGDSALNSIQRGDHQQHGSAVLCVYLLQHVISLTLHGHSLAGYRFGQQQPSG